MSEKNNSASTAKLLALLGIILLAGLGYLILDTLGVFSSAPEALKDPIKVPEKKKEKRDYKPKDNSEFNDLIASKEYRDDALLQVIGERQIYCNLALTKIRQLKLTHLAPKLREFLESEKKKKKGNIFFEIQVLKTLWSLDKTSISEEEKDRLKKAGIPLE